MTAATLSAKAIDTMLRAHYAGTPSKPSAGYYAAEVEAPDSTRRADGLWLPLHAAQRGMIYGHEVKVSRADVIAELADPMKSHAWSKFCNRWWLVVADPALVKGLEIPEHWGIMAPPDGRRSKRLMTVVRPAPALKPQDQHFAYAALLARIFYNGDDQGTQIKHLRDQRDSLLERERQHMTRERELQGQIHALGGRVISPHDALAERIRRILEIVQQDGDWSTAHEVSKIPDADVAAALLDVGRIRAAANEAGWDVRSKLREVSGITKETTIGRAEEHLTAALEAIAKLRGGDES